ncbi:MULTISPECIES: hypothetical protein [Pseudomonas]|uniref:MrpH family fimbial adhesin n=1 Tax=Pseudomonas TaxID=286 RepID=UPI000AA74228|nr:MULTISPECIES: hypothetical protein [Pseudomonas]MBJ2261990.1 hypothetical protein [Pseudomonas sp. MF6787]MBJ2291599.1 hypothetical protein [Pseudomonas sp. MF5691]MBK3455582.1 hypothetical protein [Pseudomonas sp. MF6754]MCM8558546.1 hypothetical protein [Pseudomonas shahriarae]MDI3202491.1 hypothetical protein [Pseudomonas shahriarae]
MKKISVTVLQKVFAGILLWASALQAQAYYTLTTTDSRIESGGVRYYFLVSGWTTGDTSPSPCASDDPQLTLCTIGIAALQPYSIIYVGEYNSWEVPVRHGASTLGQLLSDLQMKGFRIPLSGSILVPRQYADNNICITFTYSRVGPSVGGAYNPFGPCARVGPVAVQCEISGNATIDHGSLPDNKLSGAKASTQLDLQCRGSTNVTVSASRTNSLGVQLDDYWTLFSKITVNGKDATRGINVNVTDGQTSKLDITSTLSTPTGAVTPGKFTGFTVITVSPP